MRVCLHFRPISGSLKSAFVLFAFVCVCKHPLLLHPLLRQPNTFIHFLDFSVQKHYVFFLPPSSCQRIPAFRGAKCRLKSVKKRPEFDSNSTETRVNSTPNIRHKNIPYPTIIVPESFFERRLPGSRCFKIMLEKSPDFCVSFS